MSRNGLDTTPNPAETDWTLSTSNQTPNTQTNINNNSCSNLPSKFIVPFLSKSYILNRKNWIFQPHLQKEKKKKKKNTKIKRRKKQIRRPDHLLDDWDGEFEVSSGKSSLITSPPSNQFQNKQKTEKDQDFERDRLWAGEQRCCQCGRSRHDRTTREESLYSPFPRQRERERGEE